MTYTGITLSESQTTEIEVDAVPEVEEIVDVFPVEDSEIDPIADPVLEVPEIIVPDEIPEAVDIEEPDFTLTEPIPGIDDMLEVPEIIVPDEIPEAVDIEEPDFTLTEPIPGID
ncbi:MAG: hypothetical protein P0107_08780, partial [Nitrosomonas sp.]|nr:hypothetical protein [Nitrosomonas sp.]